MANKYRHLTSEQLAAQEAAEARFRQKVIEIENFLVEASKRTWVSYWESQEREERYWEHISQLPRLQLRRIRNRNNGRRVHRRQRG